MLDLFGNLRIIEITLSARRLSDLVRGLLLSTSLSVLSRLGHIHPPCSLFLTYVTGRAKILWCSSTDPLSTNTMGQTFYNRMFYQDDCGGRTELQTIRYAHLNRSTQITY